MSKIGMFNCQDNIYLLACLLHTGISLNVCRKIGRNSIADLSATGNRISFYVIWFEFF